MRAFASAEISAEVRVYSLGSTAKPVADPESSGREGGFARVFPFRPVACDRYVQSFAGPPRVTAGPGLLPAAEPALPVAEPTLPADFELLGGGPLDGPL